MAKIIQLTTFFYPVTGGVEQHVLELSKELIKHGHEVTVFCSDSTRTEKRLKILNDKIGKIKIRRFKTLLSISQFYKIFPSLIMGLLKHDFDIVHVHGFRKLEVYIALLISKLKHKKTVVTTHNPFFTTTRSRFLELFVKIHDLTFGKIFSRFIDHILCLTKSELPYLKKFNIKEEKISVIPNGIPDYIFKKGKKENFLKIDKILTGKYKYRVLWIGRLHKVKGLENLETAVRRLKDTLFIFAGPDDNAAKEYRELYKNYQNVLFAGPIKHNEIINIYKSADIFVLPSYHEAFGLVIIEAFAQGLPVISTNAGGPKDIVNERFGILLNPSDKTRWYINIKKLLENRKLRKQMGNFARKEAENYRWKNLVLKIDNIYKRLSDK